MPNPLSQAKRDAIITRLEQGVPHLKIAEEVNVSTQTVKNYSTNMKHHGVVLLPSISKMGRPRIMTQEMTEVLIFKTQFYDVNITSINDFF
jgi:transposase